METGCILTRRQTASKTLVGIRAAHQSKHRATGYGRHCESQHKQASKEVLVLVLVLVV